MEIEKKSMGRPLSKKNYFKLINKLQELGVNPDITAQFASFLQDVLAFDPDAKCSGELLQRKINDANLRRQKIIQQGISTYEGPKKNYYYRKKQQDYDL